MAAAETQSHGPIGRNRGARRLCGFSEAAGQSHPVAGRSSRRNLLTLAVLSALCLSGSSSSSRQGTQKEGGDERLRSGLFHRSGGARE